ncbi:haloacid dehalogenase type II [Flavobacterium sp. W22_SRS_FP1]|uniref:haloacid dehalogenase type II n=1 Tax=Flavobacterium sp. W22_SRS_FP1 TaxID=3240276 RepID=UPI003F8DFB73
MNSNRTKPVIVFDVNETLLDMAPLKTNINTLLEEPQAFRIWFGMVLHYSLVDNCTDQYHDFSNIAGAVLKMTAASLNKTVSDEDMKKALSAIKTLKAYPDVEKGLTLLQDKGFRLATLTNSPEYALKEQLTNSNLTNHFELALSIDAIKKYKPTAETYVWAAEKLSVKPEEMIMIAAHGWDLAGAANAGLATGFIAREGQSLYTLSKGPDYEASDILAMAEKLVAAYNG